MGKKLAKTKPVSQQRSQPAQQRSLPSPNPELANPDVAVAVASASPPRSRLKSWLATLGALLLLVGSAGLTVGGAWLAIQMIVDPDAILGLNRFLPAWTQIPTASQESFYTLEEIRTSLQQAGRTAGEPISLGVDAKLSPENIAKTDILLPVMTRRSLCQGDNCDQIVELRVYRPVQRPYQKEQSYWLASQIDVSGPEESFAIAPLVDVDADNQGSSRALPLTSIKRMGGKVPPGIWLLLKGEMVRGDTAIAYGRVAHYNPNRTYLGWMATWTSPVAEEPRWQQLVPGADPELVINQTVGLEPRFQMYQVKPRDFLPDPIQLEAVALAEPAFTSENYTKIMTLARAGLWSQALQWLNSLKQASQNDPSLWSADAQAQMEFIRLHAQATRTQSEQSWASPSQQALTNLIDGRWARALQVFEASADNSREIASWLQNGSEPVWKRVVAALKVEPTQKDAKAWGALLIAAQQDQAKAIAWLKKQPQTTPTVVTQITTLLKRLDPNFTDATLLSSFASQIVGTAEPVAQFNPVGWLPLDPQAGLKREAEQAWYQVQVAGFYDGERWQRLPFSNLKLGNNPTAQQLAKVLGLTNDAQLQVIVWTPDSQQTTLMATVKAVQWRGNTLRLLALGDPMPAVTSTVADAPPVPSPLAVTSAALQWIEPTTVAIAGLDQQQPQAAALLWQAVWTELAQSGQVSGSTPDLTALMQTTDVGNWSVQQIDLTGNQQPDFIVTLDGANLDSLKPPSPTGSPTTTPPRTLIVTDTGQVLYSEFSNSAKQSLLAIADLGDGGTPALVIEQAQGYQLQRWSTANKRLE